jgi:hypothetical protein
MWPHKQDYICFDKPNFSDFHVCPSITFWRLKVFLSV